MATDAPSIRIEPEHPDGDRGQPKGTDPSNNGRVRFLTGLAAVVGVAVVMLALIVLQPEEGRTADGSERRAPTPSTVAESPTTTDAEVQPDPLVANLIDLDASIREVVNASVGYLGVLAVPAPRAEPPIMRSIDGLEWAAVESVVVEPDDLDLLRSRFASFIGLRSTETGFSVLRVRQQFAAPGRSATGFFVTDRLLSDDGVEWTLDDDFTDITARQAVSLASGSGDLMLSVTPPIPDFLERRTGRIDRAIAQALPEPECELRGSSIDRQFIDSCDAEDAVATPEPECSSEYLSSVEPFEFAVVNPTSIAGRYLGHGLVTSPEVIERESSPPVVAALVRAISTPPADCVGTVLDTPDPRPMSLAIWESPEAPARHVPLDLSVNNIDPIALQDAVALGPLGDSLLLTTRNQLIRVNLDGSADVFNRDVLEGVDLDLQVPRAFPTSDGLMLVDVRDGVLRIWNISEDGVRAMQEPVFEQTGFGEVRFADSRIVLISGPSRDQVIQLSAGSR